MQFLRRQRAERWLGHIWKVGRSYSEQFQTQATHLKKFEFYGAQIWTVKSGEYKVAQTYYINNLSCVQRDTKREVLWRYGAQHPWDTHKMTAIIHQSNRFTQVTGQTFSLGFMKEHSYGIKIEISTHIIGFRYRILDHTTAPIRWHGDASLSLNDDRLSQFRYIVMLRDGTGYYYKLDYHNRTSRCVVWPAMAAKVYAFKEEIYAAYLIAENLWQRYEKRHNYFMYPDSLYLFGALTNGKRTEKRRVKSNRMTASQLYKRYKI